MGVIKTSLGALAGIGALASVPYIAKTAIPTSISGAKLYFSDLVTQTLGNVDSVVGTLAPFALPGYALYRGYKKYTEKGLWHGIESAALNYGIPAAILTALGIFSAPFATVLATGVAMRGARAIWDLNLPEKINNWVSRRMDTVSSLANKAEDTIAKGPEKIWKATKSAVKGVWNGIFSRTTPTPQPATA